MAGYRRQYSTPQYWASQQQPETNPWEAPVARLTDALLGGINQRWDEQEKQQKAMGVAQRLRDALASGDINSIANDPTTAGYYNDYFDAKVKQNLALELAQKQAAVGAQANLLQQGAVVDGGGFLDLSNPNLKFKRPEGLAEGIGEANRIEAYGTATGGNQSDLLYKPMIQRRVKQVDFEMDPKIAGATVDAKTAAELRGKIREAQNTELPWLTGRNKVIGQMGEAATEVAERTGGITGMLTNALMPGGAPQQQPQRPVGVGAPAQEMPYESKWDGSVTPAKQAAPAPSMAPNPGAGSVLNQADMLKAQTSGRAKESENINAKAFEIETAERNTLEKDRDIAAWTEMNKYFNAAAKLAPHELNSVDKMIEVAAAKMTDPTGVIRTGEGEDYANKGAVATVQQWLDKKTTGQKYNMQDRLDVLDALSQLAVELEPVVKRKIESRGRLVGDYNRRAGREAINLDNITGGVFFDPVGPRIDALRKNMGLVGARSKVGAGPQPSGSPASLAEKQKRLAELEAK